MRFPDESAPFRSARYRLIAVKIRAKHGEGKRRKVPDGDAIRDDRSVGPGYLAGGVAAGIMLPGSGQLPL